MGFVGMTEMSLRSHTRRFRRMGGLALVLAAALLLLAACGGGGGGQTGGSGGSDGGQTGGGAGTSGDEIVIGVIGPLTGDYAAEGQGFKKAIDLLVEELNAQGGVLGRQVRVEHADTGSQPDQATLAAQERVSTGVVGVVGADAASAPRRPSTCWSRSSTPRAACWPVRSASSTPTPAASRTRRPWLRRNWSPRASWPWWAPTPPARRSPPWRSSTRRASCRSRPRPRPRT